MRITILAARRVLPLDLITPANASKPFMKLNGPEARPPPERIATDALREQVWHQAGVVRDPAGLAELATSADPVAALVARFALARAESRGVHYRIAAPVSDAAFEGHFVLRPGRGLSLEQWT